MRVHALDCATMCPPSRRLVAGEGPWLAPGSFVGHCWLIESSEGLVLVDTGLGTADCADGSGGRLGRTFRHLIRPTLDPAGPAIHHAARSRFGRTSSAIDRSPVCAT